MHRLLLLLTGVVWITLSHAQLSVFNKELETSLLKGYQRNHRPVLKESDQINVRVYLTVTHVENVNEHEQTMLIHGNMIVSWKDAYLKWNPSDYNNTQRLNVDAWKIWQPALALYNSAKGNMWHIYLAGMPAMVSNQGDVVATGSFSFHVTCLFDFSRWPYDEQECPIVLADWVYDLSRVNLSDTSDKPTVRLNYDPMVRDGKKHVAGWEVYDTWRRHCYWDSSGCKDELPQGNPEWYWSLLEFGVKIRRHAPYFMLTVVLPTFLSSLLTLASFWVDTSSMAIALLVFNILLQGLFGWDLIRELPPGSGSIPRIVWLYGINLSLTALAFTIHVLIQYLETVLPKTFTIPLGQVSSIYTTLKSTSLFRSKGLSFDPQLILEGNSYEDSLEYNTPLPKVSSAVSLGSALSHDDRNTMTTSMGSTDQLVELDVDPEGQNATASSSTSEPANATVVDVEKKLAAATSSDSLASPTASPLSEQLYIFRRVFFCVFAIVYIVAFPIGTFNL